MPVQRNFLLYVCSLSHADAEEARNVFELRLPGGTGNGPARPVSFYGRFVLFRPLPSEGVIGGMRWCLSSIPARLGRGTAIVSAHMNNVPPLQTCWNECSVLFHLQNQ